MQLALLNSDVSTTSDNVSLPYHDILNVQRLFSGVMSSPARLRVKMHACFFFFFNFRSVLKNYSCLINIGKSSPLLHDIIILFGIWLFGKPATLIRMCGDCFN